MGGQDLDRLPNDHTGGPCSVRHRHQQEGMGSECRESGVIARQDRDMEVQWIMGEWHKGQGDGKETRRLKTGRNTIQRRATVRRGRTCTARMHERRNTGGQGGRYALRIKGESKPPTQRGGVVRKAFGQKLWGGLSKKSCREGIAGVFPLKRCRAEPTACSGTSSVATEGGPYGKDLFATTA